jgi:hypothetical protein
MAKKPIPIAAAPKADCTRRVRRGIARTDKIPSPVKKKLKSAGKDWCGTSIQGWEWTPDPTCAEIVSKNPKEAKNRHTHPSITEAVRNTRTYRVSGVDVNSSLHADKFRYFSAESMEPSVRWGVRSKPENRNLKT